MTNETPNTQNQPTVQKQGEQQQKQGGQQGGQQTDAGASEKKPESAGSDANKDTAKR